MTRRRREPRPHNNAPEALFNDTEALELIDDLLSDWVFVEDDHLTNEQAIAKLDAKKRAQEIEAIAAARDGNFRPLAAIVKDDDWILDDLSWEARCLIAARLPGGSKAQSQNRARPRQALAQS